MTVYTVPAHYSFYPVVAKLLLRQPCSLQHQQIIVPNHRAIDSLSMALGRCSNQPVFVPRLQVIGEDDLIALRLPRRLEHQEFCLLFATLLQRIYPATPTLPLALELARDLLPLISELQSANSSWYQDLTTAEKVLSDRQQRSLLALKQVWPQWQKIAVDNDIIDPYQHRSLVLRQQTVLTRQLASQKGRLFMVGINDLTRPVLDLAAAILQVGGELVIPNLDVYCDEATWEKIGNTPTHPQCLNFRFLQQLGVKREQVLELPLADDDLLPSCNKARTQLLHRALRPGSLMAQADPHFIPSTKHMHYIEADTEAEEARIIALLLREASIESGKTAMLVTNNRQLASRVTHEVERWQMQLDSTDGVALSSTPQGALTVQVLQLMTDEPNCKGFFDLVKNSLCQASLDAELLEELGYCEKKMRQNAHWIPALEKLGNYSPHAKRSRSRKRIKNWGKNFSLCWRQVRRLITEGQLSPAQVVDWQLHICDVITKRRFVPGSSLWHGQVGTKLAELFQKVKDLLYYCPEMSAQVWLQVWSDILRTTHVRPQKQVHPRIAIMGEQEAYLQNADRCIIANCNYGSLPLSTDDRHRADNELRRNLQLLDKDLAKSIAAQRFAVCCGQKEVFFTRSKKTGGSVTVPSPWLQRINSYLQKFYLSMQNSAYHSYLDKPSASDKRLTPSWPSLPDYFSLPAISVSAIEKLLTNPYVFFASCLLKLRPLPDFPDCVTAADFGNFCHRVLCKLGQEVDLYNSEDLKRACKRIMAEVLRDMHGSELRKQIMCFQFRKIEEHLLCHVLSGSNFDQRLYCEREGHWQLALNTASRSKTVNITCKADRLDRIPDGRYRIVDYKLKNTPIKKDVASFKKPQLLLEAQVLQHDGFFSCGEGSRVGQILYVKLKPDQKASGDEPSDGCFLDPCPDNLDSTLAAFEIKLTEVLQDYLLKGRPFEARFAKRVSNRQTSDDAYRHLARLL